MTQFKLFYQMILRPLRQERLRTAVAILSVALGVAAVLAIELAGDAAAGSFRSSMETLLGDAAFEVTAGGGVPPEAVARLARLPYAIKVHPRMEAYAMISESRRAVPLIGVDLVSRVGSHPGRRCGREWRFYSGRERLRVQGGRSPAADHQRHIR